MTTKVAFGIIPVPSEKVTSLLTSTKLTELLANHVVDFLQLSSFVDGLSYGFLTNLPEEDYEVRSSYWLSNLDSLNRYDDVEDYKLFNIFQVILSQSADKLSFHPVKPLRHLTWGDIDELLKYMDFMSCNELSVWKSKFNTPWEWVLTEMNMNTAPFNGGKK